ncbi:hypothetical protein [Hymenobacter wooponensis]|uniref:Uncharacterized protein n=1 Tax=Hymenobacter wooponensis TaxID=1525360 RepID=A0A4Z0MST4_9BACT|nr:hypothetical protein [Hymenobacter wooponensis]TGD82873.1 hypothetical protein EU557_03575 [Hymenobacter wooponensis]
MFFENIPSYRPPVAVVTMPARKIPTLQELGIRVVENIKTSVLMQGLLAKNKVTVRDTGCGEFQGTGALATFKTNEISVDPLMAQDEDCAETFVNTILQGMLNAGHATDSDLTGTEIETLVRAYAEGGIAKVPVGNQPEFANLLDLALNDQVNPVVYGDALRIWMLGDKASASKDYNQTNGLRKKLLAAAPTAGATGATGTYRGAAIDYAALKADPKKIFEVLEDLVTNCSDELQDVDDAQKAIYLTKSLYRLLKFAYAPADGENSQKLEYEKGTRTYYYDGIEIKELKVWEQFMKLDFSTASPHLALYTAPKNLIWATDLESDMTTAEFKYEARTRINWWRVLFRLGSGFAYDILVSFAV